MSETINIIVEQNVENVRISAVESTNEVAVNVNENNEIVNVKIDLIGQKGDKGDSGIQIQSDWAQTDSGQIDYIKNKPSIVTPSLQDVTDVGNTTTNSITVESATYFSILDPYDLGTENKNTNSYAYLGGDGVLGLSNGTIESQLKNTDVTEGIILEFPDKGPGSYTIATTDDISTQVNSDWNATSGVAEILNKPTIPTNTSDLTNDGADGVHPFITAQDVPAPTPQVQSDWNESNTSAVDYIKNKPTIPAAQIQSDWTQASSSAVDFIKNKPTIPDAQVNSDWNAVSGKAQILNKPTIPAAQVNSDWNSVSGVSQILNKPSIPAAQIQSDWNQTNNASLDYIKNKPTITSGTVTGVSATAPLTSTGGNTPTISTSMTTNKLIGRSTSGTGVMEEITVGSGLTLSGGTLSNSAAPTATGYYGAWQDNVTQTAAADNVGYAMIFRTTDLSNGVTVVTNGTNLTRITFANSGVYNLQFSSQFQNTGNALEDVTIWLRKNGTDVAGSSGFISVPQRKNPSDYGHIIVSWNYLLNVVAGEYYEIVWSTTNHSTVTMQYYSAGNPPPSTASVIVTVTQQSGIMAGTGVTAINSLTGSAQTMVTGTSGTDFAISSTGSTHTFNIPTASASNRGLLSAADWSTFTNSILDILQIQIFS